MKQPIEGFRCLFMNLALPYITLAEPHPVKMVKLLYVAVVVLLTDISLTVVCIVQGSNTVCGTDGRYEVTHHVHCGSLFN